MIRFMLLCLPFMIVFHKLSAQALLQKTPRISEVLIFPQQEKHVHASSIVSLPNGDLLAAWFHGSGERTADDVKIMGARLRKGSAQWSGPFVLADTPGLPDCNPILFLNSNGKLFLVWVAVQANRWEFSILRYKTATEYTNHDIPVWSWQDNILLKPNEGFATETARQFKKLPKQELGWSEFAPGYDDMIIEASKDLRKRSIGWMTRIKPLLLENGKILLPLYSDGFSFSMMAISDDDGDSWRPGLPIISRGGIQPALIQKKNGHIIAYMRDNGDAPNSVQESESADKGETWSAAIKTSIPNSGSSVELYALSDGRWAFIGNDVAEGRHRLCLYLSADEGKTWNSKTLLENEAPGKGSFSYPALIQTTDRLLHITYSYQTEHKGESIKYVIVDPAKL
ncbi:MAG: exo-alpha-sialidase [Chitinophagaceae bacterium]|nr:exo-alpha-sialidase [Chitinophagaceae bacterium]